MREFFSNNASGLMAIAEMALVFGTAIGFAVWELRKLKRYDREDRKSDPPDNDDR